MSHPYRTLTFKRPGAPPSSVWRKLVFGFVEVVICLVYIVLVIVAVLLFSIYLFFFAPCSWLVPWSSVGDLPARCLQTRP